MAEQKTEQPTQKRLRDAREKGQVAYSPDVSSTAILVAIFSVIGAFWPWFQSRLIELFLVPLRFLGEPFEEAFLKVSFGIASQVVIICLPIVGAAFVAAAFGGFVQVGFHPKDGKAESDGETQANLWPTGADRVDQERG
jgi:type III secretion protein U